MNTRAVLHLLSFLLMVVGGALAGSWAVAEYFSDPESARNALKYSAMGVGAFGLVLFLFTRGPLEFTRRDGFGIVTFGWLAATLAGALPYLLSGQIADPIPAFFESMSGFTTTGATVLTHLESVPRGLLFWRALTQWLGGMGVLVLCVAILPFLGVGGMQIYRAEMPGPSKDRLTPRITSTAKLLYSVYLLLTAAEMGLLRLGGMSWYDATCHTFTSLSTGGFSTRTASIAAYDSLYLEGVIVVFMLLAGMNFALHFRALRGDVASYFRDAEWRFYIGVWAGATLLIAFNIWKTVQPDAGTALRHAVFQTASIMTTTGYGTTDFNAWPNFSRLLLVLLMFAGGCAGSTSGGIKHVRVFVVIKKAIREMRAFMHPQAVFQIKLGQKPVDKHIVTNISAFFIIFVMLFAIATVIMTFFTPDLETASSAVAATLGNIGPGLGAVGPMQDYGQIPDAGKLVLTLCMLLGRLELYTVLILFLPGFWRK
jgi:trk system potassium uptake protein TrkH